MKRGHDGRSDVVVHRLGDDPYSSRHAPRLENPYPGDLLLRAWPAKRMCVPSHGSDQHTRMNWPLEWPVRFGRGRVYSSTFGHVWKVMSSPEIVKDAGVCVQPARRPLDARLP